MAAYDKAIAALIFFFFFGIALVITTSMLLCLLTLAQQYSTFISYFSSCIKCHASQEHRLYKTDLKQIQMDQ